jgi:hypothetical protein
VLEMKKMILILFLFLTCSPILLVAGVEMPEVEKQIKALRQRRSMLEAEIRQLDSKIESLEKSANKNLASRARPQIM